MKTIRDDMEKERRKQIAKIEEAKNTQIQKASAARALAETRAPVSLCDRLLSGVSQDSNAKLGVHLC